MISEEGQQFYKILKLPLNYDVNKDILKKNYFSISKLTHPDTAHGAPLKNDQSKDKNFVDTKLLNKAYSTIKDDFYRAKLFTSPAEKLESDFLENCMELEERILKGENLVEELSKKIEKCKKDYESPISVGKWAYFKRLLDKIRQ